MVIPQRRRSTSVDEFTMPTKCLAGKSLRHASVPYKFIEFLPWRRIGLARS